MNNKNKDNPNPMPELLMLRAKEASSLCGLAVSTWHEFRSAGKLPPSARQGSGGWMYCAGGWKWTAQI